MFCSSTFVLLGIEKQALVENTGQLVSACLEQIMANLVMEMLIQRVESSMSCSIR